MQLVRRTRKLGGGLSVSIQNTREGVDLDAPLWAINWFDYHFRRAYSLYNLLATPSVLRVGGRLHFKGERVAHLSGDAALSRSVLVIVRYPEAKKFLAMLGDPWFMTVSILRNTGLKNFVFGFTRRIDDVKTPPLSPFGASAEEKAGTWLVHQFRIEMGALEKHLPNLKRAAAEHGARLHFAGESVAKVTTRRKPLLRRARTQNMAYPLFFDAMTLWQTPDESAARKLHESPALQALRKETHSDVVGVFGRVM